MTKALPSIENGWESFAADMRRAGKTPDEMEMIKLTWFSGACAMGIILTSRDIDIHAKANAFDTVIKFVAASPFFARFRERINRGKPQ